MVLNRISGIFVAKEIYSWFGTTVIKKYIFYSSMFSQFAHPAEALKPLSKALS